MATLVGDRDAVVHAAIDESRHLFERMGAGFWLARMDAATADSPGRVSAPADEQARAADTAVAGAADTAVAGAEV